ncbi:MAG: hypothetical protein J6D28_05645 [Bacilli bacterium]|nr:hypothetical protein [Bacilli bacterium]
MLNNDKKEIIKFLLVTTFFITIAITNYYFAIDFCKVTNIPFNLTISFLSIGFGHELVLVTTGIEMIFFHYFTTIINK